jgi:hypothetical protein
VLFAQKLWQRHREGIHNPRHDEELLAACLAEAAPLTLGCSGTITTTQVPKEGVAHDPEKEHAADISVVVNFERRTVSGLFLDRDTSGRYYQRPLPIDAVDENSVSFQGRMRDNAGTHSIEGTVDRITGKIDATVTRLSPSGSCGVGERTAIDLCAAQPYQQAHGLPRYDELLR